MVKVPASADEITGPWLDAALHASGVLGAGQSVDHVDIEPVGNGLGYLSVLYRLRPRYRGPGMAPPATMVAKLPSPNPANRLTGNTVNAYARESLFYRHCSAESPCAPPAHYFSDSDAHGGGHVLLMEDLDGCRFVNQVDGVQPDDARACLQALGRHHARYWQRTAEMAWLPPFDDFIAQYALLMDAGWAALLRDWHDVMDPAFHDHAADAIARYGVIARRLQSLPCTLAHCDPRIENIAFDAAGRPRFYDWQLTSRAPAAYDLMYFFKQSMDVDVRRACQDGLLDAYLAALAEGGVSYPAAQLRADIGLATCTIWGFTAMIGNFYVRNAINERLWAVTHPRFTAMIDDFGGLDVLRSL
jgi:hypothetical protein